MSNNANQLERHNSKEGDSYCKGKIQNISGSIRESKRIAISVIGDHCSSSDLEARLLHSEHPLLSLNTEKASFTHNTLLRPHVFLDDSEIKKCVMTESIRKIEKAISCTDVTYITSIENKVEGFSSRQSFFMRLLKTLGNAIKSKNSYHLIIFFDIPNLSHSNAFFIKMLENYSNKKCGVDFGLCNVIERKSEREARLSGYIKGGDEKAEKIMRKLYQGFDKASCYFDFD